MKFCMLLESENWPVTNLGFDNYFNMPSSNSYSLETKLTVVKRYHELGENTSDLHILFSSTGTL